LINYHCDYDLDLEADSIELNLGQNARNLSELSITTSAVIVVHSSNDLEVFIDHTFRTSI